MASTNPQPAFAPDEELRPSSIHLPSTLWDKIDMAKKKRRLASRSALLELIFTQHPELLEDLATNG